MLYLSYQLEKTTTKKRHGARKSLSGSESESVEPWLERTLEILSTFDTTASPPRKTPIPAQPIWMTLRERKPKSKSGSPAPAPAPAPPPTHSPSPSPSPSPSMNRVVSGHATRKSGNSDEEKASTSAITAMMSRSGSESADLEVPKKLPRVILRLGPRPNEGSSSS
jgi:histone deacetylase HOS3